MLLHRPSTFRLPSRVTLNEQKREAWVNDLANPSIPLSKLSKNVPHGYRGEKLLDMIFARKVLVERAVWYIRAIGAIEIVRASPSIYRPLTDLSVTFQVSQKARVGFSIAQYTYEWTIILQDFVKKQLNEINLPPSFDGNIGVSNSVAGLRNNGKGRAIDAGSKGVLRDNELRKVWGSKFTYTYVNISTTLACIALITFYSGYVLSLRLLESLYEESLLDRESFLRFLILSIESTNLAQLPFVLFLTEEYLGEFLSSEPMSARLVEACFGRLKEVSKFCRCSDM